MAKNEFKDKSSVELAILVLRLKMQLMEGRFSSASGDDNKPKNLSAIRKMIARILTELGSRNEIVRIGNHGVCLINTKTKKITSLNKEAAETISSAEKELIKNNNQYGLGITSSEKKLEHKQVVDSTIDKNEKSVVNSQMKNKTKTVAIRKTQSGGGS